MASVDMPRVVGMVAGGGQGLAGQGLTADMVMKSRAHHDAK